MLVTATGLQVDVDHLKPSEIRAYDIAWSLHNLNLFRGHALAQWDALSHVGLSYMLYVQDMKGKIEAEFALALLLDSAPKAYLGDMDPATHYYRDVASTILARFQVSEEPLAGIPWDMVARYNRQAAAIAFHALFPAAKNGPKTEYEMARFPLLVKAKPTDYISILKYAAINHDVADVPGLFEVSETMKPLVAEAVPLVSEVHQEGDVEIEVVDHSAIERAHL